MEKEKKEPQPEEEEVQTGEGRSIARQDKLKKMVKQHPQREEARVDSASEESSQ